MGVHVFVGPKYMNVYLLSSAEGARAAVVGLHAASGEAASQEIRLVYAILILKHGFTSFYVTALKVLMTLQLLEEMTGLLLDTV